MTCSFCDSHFQSDDQHEVVLEVLRPATLSENQVEEKPNIICPDCFSSLLESLLTKVLMKAEKLELTDDTEYPTWQVIKAAMKYIKE